MNVDKLIRAYREEKALYERVLNLVSRQEQIMLEQPDPEVLLSIARRIDGLLEQVGEVESRIEGEKALLQNADKPTPQPLVDLLEQVRALIDRIRTRQTRVGRQLIQYVQSRGVQERAAGPMPAARAQAVYGTQGA
jgi:hypothetical protein